MALIPWNGVLLYGAGGLGGYAVARALLYLLSVYVSPLNELQGPPKTNWFRGDMLAFMRGGIEVQREWVKAYGHTFAFNSFLGVRPCIPRGSPTRNAKVLTPSGWSRRLYTSDTKAVHHVLQNSYDYQKPEMARHILAQVVGNGVLVAEADPHAQQRRILSPAFSSAHIRRLTTVFVEKSLELRDCLASEIALAAAGESTRIDVFSWLNRVTLDIIGIAGFNYDFEAMKTEGPPNELNGAFATMFKEALETTSAFTVLQAMIPIFRFIPTRRNRIIEDAKKIMFRVAEQLLKDSKAEILNRDNETYDATNGSRGRDLLSLLIRANMAKDLPSSQRLTNSGVIDQIPTFLLAGHDTTSNATTWALHALSLHPRVQAKLQAELEESPTDTPTMEELNALAYLDAVTREVLRIYAPVQATIRVAMKDDIIQLEKPCINKRGEVVNVVKISKGDNITIPIQLMNSTPEAWGLDAHEFRPERWEEELSAEIKRIPGIHGTNSMSFLGGNRGCIGYRFALMEMKALLYTLIRSFEFTPAVPEADIGKKIKLVMRPFLISDSSGSQLPLLLKPRNRD